jgi:hypothetical protein
VDEALVGALDNVDAPRHLGGGLSALSTGTAGFSDVTADPTRRVLVGVFLGQLIFGVLGVLVMSAEYGTGTIRATLSAVPRRLVVLGAKIVVFGGVALVASEVITFSAFGVGQAILWARGGGTASLGQTGVLRAVAGSGLYLAVLGLLALGLAAIIRHTAGAISAFVGVVLVLPLIAGALPTSMIQAVTRYLPAHIGIVMFSARGVPNDIRPVFSPWTGFALLVLYAVVILALGGWVLIRRDA